MPGFSSPGGARTARPALAHQGSGKTDSWGIRRWDSGKLEADSDDPDPWSLVTPGERPVPWAKPADSKAKQAEQLNAAKQQHDKRLRAATAKEAVASLLSQPKTNKANQRFPLRRVAASRARSAKTSVFLAGDKEPDSDDLANSALRMFFRSGKGSTSPFFKQVSDAFVNRQQRPRSGRVSFRSDSDATPKLNSRTALVDVRLLTPQPDTDTEVQIVDLPEKSLSFFPDIAESDDVDDDTECFSKPMSSRSSLLPSSARSSKSNLAEPRSPRRLLLDSAKQVSSREKPHPGTSRILTPRGATSLGPLNPADMKIRGSLNKSSISVRERLEAAIKLKLTALGRDSCSSEVDGSCALARSCRKGDNVELSKVAPNQWFQQHRWGRTQLQFGEAPTDDGSENKKEVADISQKELSVFEAFDLAEKLNLPAGQVTEAWKAFKVYDADDDGRLSAQEFQLLLRNILRDQFPSVKDIPRKLFMPHSYKKESTLGFSDFLTWWTEHAFDEAILLNEDQRKIRRQARQHRVPIPVVEAIKRKFDRYDNDSNGLIEFSEFHELLCELFNIAGEMRSCLPARRVRTFWREIDQNGSGEIEFDEFIPWYLRYFDPTGHCVGMSPLEEFYARVRPFPTVPRYWILGE